MPVQVDDPATSDSGLKGWCYLPFPTAESRFSPCTKREMIWQEFAKEYKKEMKDKEPLLRELVQMAKEQDITLLCSCKDEKHCHRTLLKAIVESQMKML